MSGSVKYLSLYSRLLHSQQTFIIMLISTVDLPEIRRLPAAVLLPLLLLSLYLLRKLPSLFSPNYSNPKNLPPSPPKLPLLGNLHQLGPSPHKILRSLAGKHGPLMLLHLGNVPLLVVSSAAAAEKVLKTHDRIFSSRPEIAVVAAIYGGKDVAFSPYGEYWRQVKSICVHKLLSSKKVQSFRNVREEEVAIMVDRFRASCDDHRRSPAAINVGEEFAALTNDVICRVALGKKYSDGEESGRKFKEVLESLGVLLGSFNVGEFIPWLGWINWLNGWNGRVRRVAEDLDEFLEAVVMEHWENSRNRGEDDKDFVDVLLDIGRNGEGGFHLDATSTKAVILDMFAAGTDTTFTLMEWTLSKLLKHENTMKKLKKELKNVARHKSKITEDDLDKCKYLKAVVKEVLRLHPPLPLLVPRKTTRDVKILNYDVLAGTRVVVNAWALGRDPSLWEDPEDFIPERFMNNLVDFKARFQFIPFGGGRRGCPGSAFALGLAELALANLVLNFEFELPDGSRGEDLDMSEGEGITIHRKYPLSVIPRCDSTLSFVE
ncbi:cytochrome P450 736A117-like [Andrographis paniculata]|uniref:cytochrome P450 736A117-like n=1 Tax=Andrographis paniculata TaxID=175694 RepID=UPI0021E8E903|nr:cytochrome P450 736A117-like [Andrographis paniculata]